MRLDYRLRRLERVGTKDGRCPVCRDRPGRVPVTTCRIFLPDNGRDPAFLPCAASCPAPEPSPCHARGWRPVVFKGGEVVIEWQANPGDGRPSPDHETEGAPCD